MRPLRFLRQRPVALFGIAVCAFVVWIAREAVDDGDPRLLQPTDPRPGLTAADATNEPVPLKRFLPAPPPPPGKAKSTPQATAQVLPKLKPGMTRTEVEEIVGAPDPGDIRPATVAGGRVTYHTAYETDLGPLPTVRPMTPPTPSRVPAAREPARRLVTLEFDATQPGHPLLQIHYPEPVS